MKIKKITVLADFPNINSYRYKVGDVLTDNGFTVITNQDGDIVFYCDFDKYPHLFKVEDGKEQK